MNFAAHPKFLQLAISMGVMGVRVLSFASVVAVGALAALIELRRRRRAGAAPAAAPGVTRHASLARTDGPLVIVQRHGVTSKNLAIAPQRAPLVAALEAEAARLGVRLGGGAAPTARAKEIFAAYRRISGDRRWFDDVLTADGEAMARAAGAEIGALIAAELARRGFGAAPPARAAGVLALVSPFRRTLRTQELGLLAAFAPGAGGLARAAVRGGRPAWEADDALGETPFDEASCHRRVRSAILADAAETTAHTADAEGRAAPEEEPLLDAAPDLARVAETYVSEPRTQVEELWATGKRELSGVMPARADALAARLRAAQLREYDVVWITTHKGTARELVRALLPGEARVGLEPAEAIAFRPEL